MAHELEFAASAVANVFSVREDMWHREGHVIADAPTFERALEIANLDYTVEVRPTYRVVTRHELDGRIVAEYQENDTAKITVRIDTGAELGMVGGWYTPLQNRNAFRVLTPLLDAGVAELTTGGVLRGGADAWLQARFKFDALSPIARSVFESDVFGKGGIIPYALVANNHSGRRGCLVQLTPVRVVCANTLGFSEGTGGLGGTEDAENDRAAIIRHTANGETRLAEQAERLFTSVVQKYEVMARHFIALKSMILDEQAFKRLVLDVVAPDPRDAKSFNPEARMAESTVARAEKKRDELTRLWTGGAGHTGDRSAWEAYNSAAEALDHNVELWPTKSGVYRTQAMLHGEYGRLKQQVLDGLVSLALS